MSPLRIIFCSECPSRIRRECEHIPENLMARLRKGLQEKFAHIQIMGTGCMGICPRGCMTCFVSWGHSLDNGTYMYIYPDDTERFYENLRHFESPEKGSPQRHLSACLPVGRQVLVVDFIVFQQSHIDTASMYGNANVFYFELCRTT